jgi:hypothetical protein
MNVVDLPQPAPRELYEEAIARYVKMVRGRAVAVYAVGSVRFPGLSDIDLLVVTDRKDLDGRYYYSALQRLPRRFLRLFLHEPFILPASCAEVMRHTTHYAPQLLSGRDVIRQFPPNDAASERWCRMLESYCSYSMFTERVRTKETLRGRWTIAVTSALRYLLGDAAHVFDGIDVQSYAAELDAIRAAFFESENPAALIQRAWAHFLHAFEQCDAMLRARLGTHARMETIERARVLLRGDVSSDLFDRNYAAQRARIIERYYDELRLLGIPYGGLFFVAAHPEAVRTIPETAVTSLVHNIYRVRRRLAEYAGA